MPETAKPLPHPTRVADHAPWAVPFLTRGTAQQKLQFTAVPGWPFAQNTQKTNSNYLKERQVRPPPPSRTLDNDFATRSYGARWLLPANAATFANGSKPGRFRML